MSPTLNSYTKTAVVLHWLIALGIFALIGVGLIMKNAHLPPMRVFQLYQLHKSIGVVVLLLAVVRLAWRLFHRPPDLPASMKRLEQLAAHAGHGLIYVFLIALPLSGWALVSASRLNIPTVLFGVVPWPHLPWLTELEDKAPAEALLKLVHDYGAFVFIAVIVGHIGAAILHSFKGDVPLSRMSLRGTREN